MFVLLRDADYDSLSVCATRGILEDAWHRYFRTTRRLSPEVFSGLYVLSGRLGSLLPALSEAAAENSQSGGNLADTRVAEWDKAERVCLVLDSMHVVPASASDPACWHLIMQTFGFGHRSLWH